MHLNPHMLNQTAEHFQHQHNGVETPVKKNKLGFHSHLKTAETPNADMSASKRSIADVDAEELFDNFSRIVTISESEDTFEEPEVSHQLQFETENSRLDFDQATSSMRKKRRGSRLLPEQQGQCIKIRPFMLSEDQNRQTEEEQKMKEEEEMSPGLTKRRSSKVGVMSTPTKKPVSRNSAVVEMAARKEDPFRDLEPKRELQV